MRLTASRDSRKHTLLNQSLRILVSSWKAPIGQWYVHLNW